MLPPGTEDFSGLSAHLWQPISLYVSVLMLAFMLTQFCGTCIW